jgi:hypothetical protein
MLRSSVRTVRAAARRLGLVDQTAGRMTPMKKPPRVAAVR